MKALVDYWRPKLRLQDWQVQVIFDEAYNGRAACAADPPYKEAILTFNLQRCSDREEDLEGCVVHEMSHCHTWGQAAFSERFCTTEEHWKDCGDLEEAATTELTLLMLQAYPRLYPL